MEINGFKEYKFLIKLYFKDFNEVPLMDIEKFLGYSKRPNHAHYFLRRLIEEGILINTGKKKKGMYGKKLSLYFLDKEQLFSIIKEQKLFKEHYMLIRNEVSAIYIGWLKDTEFYSKEELAKLEGELFQ